MRSRDAGRLRKVPTVGADVDFKGRGSRRVHAGKRLRRWRPAMRPFPLLLPSHATRPTVCCWRGVRERHPQRPATLRESVQPMKTCGALLVLFSACGGKIAGEEMTNDASAGMCGDPRAPPFTSAQPCASSNDDLSCKAWAQSLVHTGQGYAYCYPGGGCVRGCQTAPVARTCADDEVCVLTSPPRCVKACSQ